MINNLKLNINLYVINIIYNFQYHSIIFSKNLLDLSKY